MKIPSKTRFLPGIAKSLRDVGYQTSYIYGGDINFTNMRSYLMTTGFDKLHWQKDYTLEEQHSANWGVRDDITFATLYEQIAGFKSDEHYLIGYSTLSSHEPWDVPTHELEEEIPNAFHYLDQCIGTFIEKVRKTPQWDNLLIVLLPDHGFTYFGVSEEHEMHDHVPMLWLGGALKEPRRIDVLCNQTDLPATLLGQLGLPHDDFLFSRDVMSRNYTYPFAVHTYNNGITMKDSTGFAVYDLNANRIIVDKSTDSEALIKRGMAILQTASEHINRLGTNQQHETIQ
jgi:phosphoglycerol transferase MdoB-like AlkP superfamily enzyme